MAHLNLLWNLCGNAAVVAARPSWECQVCCYVVLFGGQHSLIHLHVHPDDSDTSPSPSTFTSSACAAIFGLVFCERSGVKELRGIQHF